MGTSSHLATLLDAEMLRRNGVKAIYHWVGWDQIIAEQGARGLDASKHFDGRFLLRYVRRSQQGRFTSGSTGQTFVTPTPYAPEEAVSWLSLPFPGDPPALVLLLDPRELGYRDTGPIYRVYGPRWVPFGRGIEYLLYDGFPERAIVPVADGPGGRVGRWELEVR